MEVLATDTYPHTEQRKTPELLTVENGFLYITREDAVVQIDRDVNLQPGECLTAPLRLDLLSPAALQVALHPDSETSLRSKLAHLGIESNLLKLPNSEEMSLAITNYGNRDILLGEGLLDFARFLVKGQELRGEELEEAVGRITLKGSKIDFWENIKGEQGLSFPLTHRYIHTGLTTPVEKLSALPTPRDRNNLINHFGLQQEILNGHKPTGPDHPMIIAGTSHLELPEELGMLVIGAYHENGEVSPHGNATFMDPNTKWSMNVEVFSAHDSHLQSAEAKVYYVKYI